MIRLHTLRVELRPTIQLAMPLVLAEIGWMSLAIVDPMMGGRLPDSAVAIGAVSLGSILFHARSPSGRGLVVAPDRPGSPASSAGPRGDRRRALLNTIYLTLL